MIADYLLCSVCLCVCVIKFCKHDVSKIVATFIADISYTVPGKSPISSADRMIQDGCLSTILVSVTLLAVFLFCYWLFIYCWFPVNSEDDIIVSHVS